jgi:diadenosine tetraphosphate (Ap4A) HIT family hydrolase
VSFPDAFPLNPGHTLIVSRRHVSEYESLSAAEQAAMWQLIPEVWQSIRKEHSPAGYNIGINVGAAAGQTVDHVHLHVIPRYAGDVEDPRGGIRWVIPARARYWT